MRKGPVFVLCIISLLVAFGLRNAGAYPRYNDGCQNCHGAFTDGLSPKGTVFPGNDKHSMHRSSGNMNTDCNLCHTSGDNRDPFLSRSDGTNDTPGMGCTGCHEKLGLRAHHLWASVTLCQTCHYEDGPPPTENTQPAYYGSPDTNAASSCNPTPQAGVNENWSVGDFTGLDNDGDGLYDGADPDCGAVTATPGLLTGLLVSAHDRTNRVLMLNFDDTACQVSNANLYAGPLDQVGSAMYTDQDCGIGNNGTHAWTYPVAPEAIFFLIVGHDGAKEGSYGTDSAGAERDPAGLCPETWDLTHRCDLAR